MIDWSTMAAAEQQTLLYTVERPCRLLSLWAGGGVRAYANTFNTNTNTLPFGLDCLTINTHRWILLRVVRSVRMQTTVVTAAITALHGRWFLYAL